MPVPMASDTGFTKPSELRSYTHAYTNGYAYGLHRDTYAYAYVHGLHVVYWAPKLRAAAYAYSHGSASASGDAYAYSLPWGALGPPSYEHMPSCVCL